MGVSMPDRAARDAVQFPVHPAAVPRSAARIPASRWACGRGRDKAVNPAPVGGGGSRGGREQGGSACLTQLRSPIAGASHDGGCGAPRAARRVRVGHGSSPSSARDPGAAILVTAGVAVAGVATGRLAAVEAESLETAIARLQLQARWRIDSSRCDRPVSPQRAEPEGPSSE